MRLSPCKSEVRLQQERVLSTYFTLLRVVTVLESGYSACTVI